MREDGQRIQTEGSSLLGEEELIMILSCYGFRGGQTAFISLSAGPSQPLNKKTFEQRDTQRRTDGVQ
jgi:hypothetical protein